MPSYSRPGVFFEEVISPAEAVTGVSLSAAAFIGPHARGPETPVRIVSWSGFLRNFGELSATYPHSGGTAATYLGFAVYSFFANGGREAYVCRVPGSGATAATKTLVDRAGTPEDTLRIDAKNSGTWGNLVYIDIVDVSTDRFDLYVRVGGTADQYIAERWLDISMDAGDSRYAPSLINSESAGSLYIAVTDLASPTAAPDNRPAAQTGTALATGADGAAVVSSDITDALPNFDAVDVPLNLNVPGDGSATTINGAVSYAAERGDVFVVADPPASQSVTDVSTALVSSLTASSYGALYYPWVHAADPSSSAAGAMRLLPPGGAILGLYAQTDVTRGVHKTPAGVNARVAGAIGVETKLTAANLDTLNAVHVNAIRQIPGAGIVVMGGRTLKVTGSDKYIAVRRSLIYIRSSLLDSTRFAIFEPNDGLLWQTLRTIIDRFLLEFWQAGGLRGETAGQAYYVKCDDELNTPQSIAAGEVKLEIGVALQYPAEFVVIRLSQREVGATATVAAAA